MTKKKKVNIDNYGLQFTVLTVLTVRYAYFSLKTTIFTDNKRKTVLSDENDLLSDIGQ